MQSGVITDKQISASSEWDPNHAVSQGRLFFESTANAYTWLGMRNDANLGSRSIWQYILEKHALRPKEEVINRPDK